MALTYPLTTLSTRSQVSKSGPRISQVEAFKKIMAAEGPKGFYAGIHSAVFGIAVTQYVYYYWYELVKAALERAAGAGRALTIAENMLTGAIAGAATASLTNPIWVVNTRQVVKNEDDNGKPVYRKQGTVETALKIFREDGLKGFWQGIFPALILVINPVIQFTVFERLKTWLQTRRGTALGGLDFFALGAISKLAATSLTYPYIVVKARMQLKQTDEAHRYKSVIDGFRKIIASEGVKGLYKGIEAKLVQSVLASAFTFAFKEQLFTTASWLLILLRLRAGKVAAPAMPVASQ
ncbi:hypothetical protein HKX48_000737 [Thoreauomyces humboldtii]|nr:hypothetical protein HKX48_000737 [Thoreauomyces humboldtii]